MSESTIALPSKPRIVSEDGNTGVFEIDGLYPGYGHTLGNSLRRIILSSLPGAAIVSVKIDGVDHEFSTMEGVREDVVTMLLNLKRVRLGMHSEVPETITLEAKGPKKITAGDIDAPTQVEILNPEQHIAEIVGKNTNVSIEMSVEQGLGYVPRESLQKEKVDIGTIALDANFTPIRRANYEVENMRVGDRTDFNRLRVTIETDGTYTPREALERAIEIMITQLRAVVGFQEEEELGLPSHEREAEKTTQESQEEDASEEESADADMEDIHKTRIEDLNIATRTANALTAAGIRTLGGLVRKKRSDILEVEGIGEKALEEINEALSAYNVSLKEDES